ncbi:MAG: dienelactone hydrolase family protein [Anaerolineaceae bacterium]|nr:dienelactone hydrolase family protein [Anaerolineaceae bacterium]
MTEQAAPREILIDNWPFKVLVPEQPPTSEKRLLLLLHGHLGNENVMWILTKPIPKSFIMLAPRAPLQLGPDQYSWHAIESQWPDLEPTYRSLGSQLLSRVDQWIDQNGLNLSQFNVMGFSQGAVMAYALSFLFPERVNQVAALAGFVPFIWQSTLKDHSLAGRSYFISNGTEDEVIPIHKAHQTIEWLKEKGAQVTYCEGHTGHKLSANCFKGMGDYFHSPSADEGDHHQEEA